MLREKPYAEKSARKSPQGLLTENFILLISSFKGRFQMEILFIDDRIPEGTAFVYLLSSPKIKCFSKENTVFTLFHSHASFSKLES